MQAQESNFIAVAAQPCDVEGILAVFEQNRFDPSLLPREVESIRADLQDFIVVKTASGQVLGCAALKADSKQIAEILSVGVLPTRQGKGVGSLLIRECERLARARGYQRLWLATMKPDYFARFGYRRFSKWKLPARVLLRKLRLVLKQPVARWWPEILGPMFFMERRLGPE